MMRGMTLKQAHRAQFIAACDAFKQAQADLAAGRPHKFAQTAVTVHALKGLVPRSMWRLARTQKAGA